MFWNVNGLRARWTAKELGFKEGVESKNPDVCAVLEVRSDWRNLAKMDGFESWLRDKEYHFCYFMWTTEDKAGIGKAGVALLCKEKPERVWFGVEDEGKDLVGRVVRAEFKDTVIVATYHPQGGFTEQTLARMGKTASRMDQESEQSR
jgi:exonuclease III